MGSARLGYSMISDYYSGGGYGPHIGEDRERRVGQYLCCLLEWSSLGAGSHQCSPHVRQHMAQHLDKLLDGSAQALRNCCVCTRGTECLPEVFQQRLALSQRSVVYLFKNLHILGANLQIWAHQDSPTESSRTLEPGLQMKSVNAHSTLFGICSISLSLPSWNSLIPSISHATST